MMWGCECAYDDPFLFPGWFFYVYMKSFNPKNPEGPTSLAPNPSSESPKPKNAIQDLNP